MSHRYKSFVNLLMLCLLCFSALSPAAVADTLTIPNSFTAGTPAQASQVNANFNAITSWSANIANDNIKSGAGIALTKLDQTTELFVKRAATNRCVSAGVTGDTTPRIALYTDGSIGMGPGSASAIDVGFARGSSSTIKALSITAPASPVTLHTAGMLVGSDFTSNYFAWLATDGLHLTAGSAPATAGMVTGPSADTIAIRNNNNSADGALTCGALTASGALTCGALTASGAVAVTGTTTLNSTLTSNALIPGIKPGGRLTLTSGTPVTGDVTGAGTLYYTPYVSNIYPAYSSSTGKYTAKTFTEASLTLSISSGTNYDIFGVYTSGSSPTLSAVAWTNDTTRATALVRSGTTGGLLVKNGDAESLYLGTIRGSGANVTAKSRAAGQLYVWNMYNRVMEDAQAQDTTDSWTYTTAAYQEARAQTTEGVSRVGIVRGLDDESVDAIDTSISANTTVGVDRRAAIGVDGTTPASTIVVLQQPVANHLMTATPVYKGKPGLGYHTLRRLEYSTATGTTTWYGDTAGTLQSGLRVSQPM